MRFLIIILLTGFSALSLADNRNGFDLTDALIPEAEILSGGPSRDGIPAISNPKFETAAEATWLKAGDRILGVQIDDTAKAYPIRILDWHEIVNDRIGQQHFTVTYCPLCGTGMIFDSNIAETALQFGVSGLLYNSDVLLYDRNSESLWSQILAKAVSGPMKGVTLPQLPSVHTTFSEWKKAHPETLVLSRETGYSRNYRKGPYTDYEKTRRLFFKVSNKAPRKYHPKEQVLGISSGNTHKAYPFSELSANTQSSFVDTVGNSKYQIVWNEDAKSVSVFDQQGSLVPTITGFWFAWYTFYPDTQIFTAN